MRSQGGQLLDRAAPRTRPAGLLPLAGDRRARALRTWVFDHDHADPLSAVCELVGRQHPTTGDGGGWLVMLGYGLGRRIEPSAGAPGEGAGAGDPPLPLAVAQRWAPCPGAENERPGGFAIAPLRSSMGRGEYVRRVERVRAYIAAGDIYQANLAHHLGGAFEGDIDACAAALARAADPRYGATMVFDHRGVRHGVCSISPELFLAYDPDTRVLRTEPMKGTRPAHGGNEAELRESVKDRAELDMITDLMRNDLGRVCELGSVRVVEPRHIESHGSGVLQASSIVEGTLRAGMDLREILAATFPPGSVTGAPKVRAMQVIEELEDLPRGAYCGSMLAIDDRGGFTASVAIRTAHIRGEPDPTRPGMVREGWFDFPVGAGIVADSDPQSEWAETLTKGAVLGAALGVEIDPGS